MAFIFRLQRILDLRVALEKTAKLKLAEALSCYETARERVEGLTAKRDELLVTLRELYSTGILPVASIQRKRMYLGALERQIALAYEALRQAEAAVEAARTKLLEAARARQTLERLREKHYAVYEREQARREQKILDEVGARPNVYPVAAEGDITAYC